jgi:hypothetical protein
VIIIVRRVGIPSRLVRHLILIRRLKGNTKIRKRGLREMMTRLLRS